MNRDGYFNVLVAEDEQIILEDVIEKLEKTGKRFKVIASAMNGEDALQLVEQLKPDVLVTDIKMPVMDGLELIKKASSVQPGIEVVIISGFNEFSYAQQAIKLGVTDYLLKPLRMEALLETMQSIENKLMHKLRLTERDIIIQDINGIKTTGALPSSLKNSSFMLYLLCLGNLYDHTADALDPMQFHQLWNTVEWAGLIDSCFNPGIRWWVVDEKIQNKKFLIAAWEKQADMPEPGTAAKVGAVLAAALNGMMPVTVCSDETGLVFQEIWETARNLRKVLKANLVPCRSSVIRPGDIKPPHTGSEYDDLLAMGAIERSIRQNRLDLLNSELKSIFSQWKNAGYSQVQLEKLLIHLVRGILKQLGCLEDGVLSAAEMEICIIIAVTNDIDMLFNDVLQLLGNYIYPQKKAGDSSEELVLKLEEDIRANLANPINVAYLAEKFNFNPSYIIRVFKKYKGEPPMQYLISLRINEAKRLIGNNQDLDFKSISEVVGYTDPHYFSRVFKNMTGMSPSEYRESIKDT